MFSFSKAVVVEGGWSRIGETRTGGSWPGCVFPWPRLRWGWCICVSIDPSHPSPWILIGSYIDRVGGGRAVTSPWGRIKKSGREFLFHNEILMDSSISILWLIFIVKSLLIDTLKFYENSRNWFLKTVADWKAKYFYKKVLIPNECIIQVLMLVLRSLQNSYHDFKVCFKICKHQVSNKTETLMKVKFSSIGILPF